MILQALNGHYERLSSKGQVPPYGYSAEKVSYAIVLSTEGQPVDVIPLLDTSGKKPRPSVGQVPQARTRTSGIKPNFLWDNTKYTLGCGRDKETKQSVPTEHHYAAFKKFHQALLEDIDDRGVKAFLMFLGRWDPEKYSELAHAEEMLDSNVVFRLDGEQAFLHERAAAQDAWKQCLAESAGGTQGMCLVTGAQVPIARLHPSIKGVADAKSSGAPLVSFNKNSFESFGKDQGENAPVSETAAFGYATALNALLAFDGNRRVQIGDATTVFWAEAAGRSDEAEKSEYLIAQLLDPQSHPSDEEETTKVADTLKLIAEGRPLEDIAPGIHSDTRFYVLGLAPNAARLSVRYWHATSVGHLFEQIVNHWQDMRLDPPAWQTPPSVWRLLCETAVQRKRKNVSPVLGGALMRSILTGARYPRTVLSAVITRFRADGMISPLRVAIVKACIRREERLRNPEQEDTLMSLDRSSDTPSYNLGRLFAVYAYAEKHNTNPKATIRDKYSGAASATPQRVFPVLMRGYEHNRSALLKGPKKAGAGVRADRAVTDILDRLSGAGEMPATLSIEEQGRFFIGYYHQEKVLYSKPDTESESQSNLEE